MLVENKLYSFVKSRQGRNVLFPDNNNQRFTFLAWNSCSTLNLWQKPRCINRYYNILASISSIFNRLQRFQWIDKHITTLKKYINIANHLITDHYSSLLESNWTWKRLVNISVKLFLYLP